MIRLPIPSDELTALYECHLHFGRKAKAVIRQAWYDGNFSVYPAHIDYSALQRFRNSAHGGPSVLKQLSLTALARDLCIQTRIKPSEASMDDYDANDGKGPREERP